MKRLFSLLLCGCILCCLISGCAKTPPDGNPTTTPSSETTTAPTTVPTTPTTVSLQNPVGAGVDFHTELQFQYLYGPYNEIAQYARGTKNISAPLPILLSWDANADASSYKLRVWEASGEGDAWEMEVTGPSYQLYNCKIGTTYSWQVDSLLKDGTVVEGEVRPSFTTSDLAPRNINCPGITNMRDIGGWKTASGAVVRQGLLYRCARLNNGTSAIIKKSGLKVMTDQLKIRTEVDLRLESQLDGLSESSIDTARYLNFPIDSDKLMTEENNQSVCRMFECLADENNYPMIFHCSIGTDRTGYIAYLLNGFLGVAQEDLYRDYLFSNFGNIGSSRSTSNIRLDYVSAINRCTGRNLSEKTQSYLLSIGVTQAQLDSIRDIFLGDKATPTIP